VNDDSGVNCFRYAGQINRKENFLMIDLMPVFFFGHGNPMNALSKNIYTDGWASIGKSIPRPKAVLSVSAHWYISACAVTSNPAPRTIHDFGGFPRELYQVKYTAPGSPELALRVKDLLAPASAGLDENWGLDHGTWSVLTHVFPKADIPVIQLSIDMTQPPAFHYETGKRLAALREEGVLVIGSGNIVHNLTSYAWGAPGVHPFDWALRFEKKVRGLMVKGDDARVVDYEGLGPDATLSVPTPDHYLPMIYALAVQEKNEPISFTYEGFQHSSVSMRCFQIG
jgi:4,5-DOPA dioxygenase extradiol